MEVQDRSVTRDGYTKQRHVRVSCECLFTAPAATSPWVTRLSQRLEGTHLTRLGGLGRLGWALGDQKRSVRIR